MPHRPHRGQSTAADLYARLGNAATLRLIQARRAAASTEAAEREADRVAALLSRKEGCACPAASCMCSAAATTIQRKASEDGPPQAVPASALAGLRAGSALDGATRATMESHFGAPFGDVRVHADHHANELATATRAEAFTSGSDIVFANGRYEPSTETGRELLAHELTHVVQQRAAGPSLQSATDPTQMSIGEAYCRELGDQALDRTAELVRVKLAQAGLNEGERQAQLSNLSFIQAEQLRRRLSAARVLDTPVDRPAGLPADSGYALQAANVPEAVAAGLPEGRVVNLAVPGPTPTSTASAQSDDDLAWPRPTTVGLPLASASYAMNSSINAGLMQTGFTAAGNDAVGLIGMSSLFNKGAYIPESLSIWGHTAVYVRVNGQIVIVRGFTPEMTSLIGKMSGVESGSTAVPALISDDASMFTKTGAKTIEYPVSAETAHRLAGRLPEPGLASEVGVSPARYTARPADFGNTSEATNCIGFATAEAEGALGGTIGPASSGLPVTSLSPRGPVPNTAGQGQLMRFMNSVEEGTESAASTPGAIGEAVASGMPRGLQVLKWGGRVFFVIGLATIPLEIFLAPSGSRVRTGVGAVAGFAGGMAAGAAAGLVCGPGAPVCSVVLGLGFGIAGALGARWTAEQLYDAIVESAHLLAESPGSLFAPPMATTLAVGGGLHRLVMDPGQVQRAQQARAYIEMMEKRRRDLETLRRELVSR